MNVMQTKSKENIAQMIQDFNHAIQPALKQKLMVYSLLIPDLIIDNGNIVRAEYRLTNDQQALIDVLDEHIRLIGRSIFGKDWTGVRG